MNDENLKPFHERTERESREIRRKGGIAAGKARREKRAMREALEDILTTPAPAEVKRKLAAAGFDAENADFQLALLATQIIKALKGDTRAAIWISDILGERVKVIHVEPKIDESRKALEAYLNERGNVE